MRNWVSRAISIRFSARGSSRAIVGFCWLLVWWLLAGSQLQAEVYRVGPDDPWAQLLSSDRLQPGDEVWLAEGLYSDPRKLSIQVCGSPDKPIVIRAAPGAHVLFRRPDARQNTFNLEGTQYLELRDFEIQGGSTAIRIGPAGERQAKHVRLENLHIHHVGGEAVTCNHPGAVYSNMVFRRNHIHHTAGHGEAFYLGGNNASAIIHDSLIESNYIHDLNGEAVSQGDGIEIKPGGYGNRIITNVIHDTRYPGITVYGSGGQAVNEIVGNWVWRTGDHGIQVAADAVVSDNIVAAAGQNGIYSREHQGVLPGNLIIRRNWILAAGREAALRIHQAQPTPSDARPIRLIDNQLWSIEGLAMRLNGDQLLELKGNVGSGNVDGLAVVAEQYRTGSFALPLLSDLPADHPAVQAMPAAKFAAYLRATWKR